jgi:hypothetical protein
LTLFRSVTNDGSAGGWGSYDGFLDVMKWEALKAGATPAEAKIPVAGSGEPAGRVVLPVFGNPLAPWELLVYDLRGRLIRWFATRLLATGELLNRDGREDHGRPVPAGGYLLRAGQAGAAATRQVVRVR